MTDVTFNEPQYAPSGGSRGPDKPSVLSQIVISLGLAKDEASAQKVLAISAGVIALLAIGVYVFTH
jgi:hypothetical protein